MGRIPSLDGIRAVAVALVLACHYGNDFGISDFFNVGDLGVRIFFVISGFLITSLLLKELKQAGSIDLKRFYFRRTLRIFPPFYFYLGAMLALSALGLCNLTFRGALPAFTYTSNYWTEWNLSGFVTSHSWSLATEEQFYLIWPFVLWDSGANPRVMGPVRGRLCIASTAWHHLRR
jgi:peptidoglycan/LPS O-acetylase OafA/YrhL